MPWIILLLLYAASADRVDPMCGPWLSNNNCPSDKTGVAIDQPCGASCSIATCCRAFKCKKPSTTTGYVFSGCGDGSYTVLKTRCSVKCADGFHFQQPEGQLTHEEEWVSCNAENADFQPFGCVKDMCDDGASFTACPANNDIKTGVTCVRGANGKCPTDQCCTPRTCNTPTSTAGYTITSGCIGSTSSCSISSTCAEGYHRIGAISATCLSNGDSWTFSGCAQDTCVDVLKSNDCPSNKPVLSSDVCSEIGGCTLTKCCRRKLCSVTTDQSKAAPYIWNNCANTDDQTCTVTCASGYHREGTLGVTCNADKGNFVVAPGQCKVNECDRPADAEVPAYRLSNKGDCPSTGSTCKNTQCAAGYYLPLGTGLVATCSNDGAKWAFSGCVAMICIEPSWGNIEPATINTVCSWVHSCNVKCKPGYHGNPTAVCLSQGAELTIRQSDCVQNECYKPNNAAYDASSCSNSKSTSCSVTCKSGYVQTGSGPLASCPVDNQQFVVSGCSQASCVPPSDWTGYVPVGGDDCSGTSCSVACASGYHEPSNQDAKATCATTDNQNQKPFALSGCVKNTCQKPDAKAGYNIPSGSECNNAEECAISCATGYIGKAVASCPIQGSNLKFQLSGCVPLTCVNYSPCGDGETLLPNNLCPTGTCGHDQCCQSNTCTMPVSIAERQNGCGLSCNCPNQQSCESGAAKDKCHWDGTYCVRKVDASKCPATNPSQCLVVDDPLANGCGNGKCSCPNPTSCGNQDECVWVPDANAPTLVKNGWTHPGYCARKVYNSAFCGCKCHDIDCVGGWVDSGLCSEGCKGTKLDICQITTNKFLNGDVCPCADGATRTTVVPCTEKCAGGNYQTCNGYFIPGDCDVTCGGGTRTETYYMPAFVADRDCTGFNGSTRTAPCNAGKCPKNCKGNWEKKTCSVTCGEGTYIEEFEVEEDDEDGGSCPQRGQKRNGGPCSRGECPVDCDGGFVDDDACDKECGGGKIRKKFIHKNKDAYENHRGKPCDHDDGYTEDKQCNTQDCTCDGYWVPQGECNKECGGGKRKRKWHDIKREGPNCPHKPGVDDEDDEDCNTDPCPEDCDGHWEPKPGAKCSVTCGTGTIEHRFVVDKDEKHGGKCAMKDKTKSEPCDAGDCPEDCAGEPVEGDCDKSCGGGLKLVKYLHLKGEKHGGKKCKLEDGSKKYKSCNTQPCPVKCEGHWEHSHCDKECGHGKYKSKFVVTKKNKHGGEKCEKEDGDEMETECNTHECPVHCEGDWEEGQCSKSCLGGTAVHTFKIKHFEEHGGKACLHPHGATKILPCNTGECKIPCVGEWRDHGICSKTCGGGTQHQRFHIIQKAKGGASCPHSEGDEQTVSCHAGPCHVDCRGEWRDETRSCSRPCGTDGEIKQFFRVKERAIGDGARCTWTDPKTQEVVVLDDGQYHYRMEPCNIRPCGKDCIGAWEPEGDACSKTCGWGTTTLKYVIYKEKDIDGQSCDHTAGKLITKPCHLGSCHVYKPTSSSEEEPRPPVAPPVPPPPHIPRGKDCVARWHASPCSKTCGWGRITETWNIETAAEDGGRCEHHDGKTRTKPCLTQKCEGTSSTSDNSDWGGGSGPIDQHCEGHWEKLEKCTKPCGGGKRREKWVEDKPQKGKGRHCGHTHGYEDDSDEDCNTDECPKPPPVCTRHEDRDEVEDDHGVRHHGCGWTCNCPNKESCQHGTAKQNCFWDDDNKQCRRVVDDDDVDTLCNSNAPAQCHELDDPSPANGCGKGCHCPNKESCEGGNEHGKLCKWIPEEDPEVLGVCQKDNRFKDFKSGYCVRVITDRDEANWKCGCNCGQTKKCRMREDRDPKTHGCGWACHCPNKVSCESGEAKKNCIWVGSEDAGECQRVIPKDFCDEAGKKCYVINKHLVKEDDTGCDSDSCACKNKASCEKGSHKNCQWMGDDATGVCVKEEDDDEPQHKDHQKPCGCKCDE